MVLQQIIPSYTYSQYMDDDDIIAFANAFNMLAQEYLNTIINLGLPFYPNFTGFFLDWVGTGLYGYPRPIITTSQGFIVLGAINSRPINYPPEINGLIIQQKASYVPINDDIYIRCLNWHFFKGDGKIFSIEWLKRRVSRFLFGPGEPPAGQKFSTWDFDVATEYQISVTFGPRPYVFINILTNLSTQIQGTILNTFQFNTRALNALSSVQIAYQIPALMPILQGGIASGALETPFQYKFVVNGSIPTPPPPPPPGQKYAVWNQFNWDDGSLWQ